MIITKTPFRMSFFGGGTDYPGFFEKYGGSVISTTFDKYIYVSVRHLPRFFEYTNEITYNKIERVTSVDQIEHPTVREAMRLLKMEELRVSYDADLPARSGLGSSSSFAVGMLNAFYALKGRYASKKQLALDAIKVEREMCKENGGWQDQIEAAYGGFNRIDFNSSGFEVKPIIISPERKKLLNDHIMLFFTGFSRISSDIAAEQVKATNDKVAELKHLLEYVDIGEKILTTDIDIGDFGRLLDEYWQLKRCITTKITTDSIDGIYATAKKAGALGGKIMGAGGGGFIMLFVPPEKQPAVKQALSNLLYVPFKFEESGTSVQFFNPEVYLKRGE